ncbi:hypothetical protein [Jiella mangrovi]|uniref:Uncharacterized protein n=1 Tax=Jiella mangrovi TaxID=2821407 RepID=A0ABS4BIY7_9HYPH|nr:hypothetical protein [Jiella mangrovi]MBP0616727.1 hypothetical protein [Jiella mangrovi]
MGEPWLPTRQSPDWNRRNFTARRSRADFYRLSIFRGNQTSATRLYTPRRSSIIAVTKQGLPVNTKIFTLFAAASVLVSTSSFVHAQDASSQESFEVSSLRLDSLPIPTSRAEAIGSGADTRSGIDAVASPDPKIRRTATGIRIVGPVYFPEERQ